MLPRAIENAVAGHIWTSGRYLPTPGLSNTVKFGVASRAGFAAQFPGIGFITLQYF